MTTTAGGSRKRPRNSAATTSSYFANSRHENDGTGRPYQMEPSSPHFLRSPSSAYGSLPLSGNSSFVFSTWTMLKEPSCCRFKVDQKANQACIECRAFIQDATSHFQNCPQFSQSFSVRESSLADDTTTSFKGEWIRAEQSVRHLCPNRCYLRAYAASRDWVFLRRDMAKVADQSVDGLLQGWSCKLLHHQADDTRAPGERESDKNKRSIPPRTIFVSSSGQIFRNQKQVFQALGISSDESKSRDEYRVATTIDISRRQGRSGVATSKELVGLQPRKKAHRTSMINAVEIPMYTCSTSPMGMLEELFAEDPWKLLLSTILLNRTRRIQVDGCIHAFLEKWSSPEEVIHAEVDEISSVIAPLGMHHRRAKGLSRFCKDYLQLLKSKRPKENGISRALNSKDDADADPSRHLTRNEILQLYDCGSFAADAYEIFVRRNWSGVNPSDHALRAFVNWKRRAEAEMLQPIAK